MLGAPKGGLTTLLLSACLNLGFRGACLQTNTAKSVSRKRGPMWKSKSMSAADLLSTHWSGSNCVFLCAYGVPASCCLASLTAGCVGRESSITTVLFDLYINSIFSGEQSKHSMAQSVITCLNEDPFHKLYPSFLHVSHVFKPA